MLLVGSSVYDFGRDARDIDYIATPKELEIFKNVYKDAIVLAKPSRFGETLFIQGMPPVEFDISETGQELIQLVLDDNFNMFRDVPLSHTDWTVENGLLYIPASPAVLLALKLSHRYLKNSPHFIKTMADIHLLRLDGVTVPDSLTDWLKRRSKETYNYSHPSLNRDKQSFFSDDGIGYVYDHDSIHEAVKTFDTPAFNLIKKEAAEVYCSKEKFYEVSQEIRLATVLEEALVLSLERYLVPNDFKTDQYKGFLIGLEKICTSITSGWFREFAWENYNTVVRMYNPNYVERFKQALAEGKIKPYEK